MKLLKINLLIILLIITYGCSSTDSTVRTEKIAIVPQPIEVLLPTTNVDDYVHAIKIDLNISEADTVRDTLIDIKYYPKRDLMDVKVQNDTIFISDKDTIKVEKVTVIETTIWEKFGYGFAGFAAVMILVIIFKKLI